MLGSSEESTLIRSVNCDELIVMVVGGGNESYSELGIVSGSCAGDWVDIIVLLLHRTRIVGLQAGIVELGGKGECHVLDGNVTD